MQLLANDHRRESTATSAAVLLPTQLTALTRFSLPRLSLIANKDFDDSPYGSAIAQVTNQGAWRQRQPTREKSSYTFLRTCWGVYSTKEGRLEVPTDSKNGAYNESSRCNKRKVRHTSCSRGQIAGKGERREEGGRGHELRPTSRNADVRIGTLMTK